jgi:AcrR family transcriptional regulator
LRVPSVPSVRVRSATRQDKARQTRTRIAEAALELFVSKGYAETTIDDIAAAARVGRRTIFRYFPTKDSMLFDHFTVRREVALQRLAERPLSEPPLVSLHAVLREWCAEGYDRRLLAQVRAVLAAEPLAGERLSGSIGAFERSVVETLQHRLDGRMSSIEAHALTKMACTWFLTAAHVYLMEGRRSLVKCFDEVVAICVQSGARDLGTKRANGR